MKSQFKDKSTEFAAYRMFLVGVNIVLDMLVVLAVAAAVPRISTLGMCSVCFIVVIITLVWQVRIDHSWIFSGQLLLQDEAALYAAVGIFGLGFGRRHRRNRRIKSYRYHYIERVRSVENKPLGIRVKADVYTATNAVVHVDQDIFETPGAMKRILMEQGKKRRVVFRIEHNLAQGEEVRLLRTLEGLK